MERWKNLLCRVTKNINSGDADNSSAEWNEKIDFAVKFVDTLSTLESGLHTSDDPEEIAYGAMRIACEFYQADWCSFLTVDLDLGLWTPYWWYNTKTIDQTLEFTNEVESAAKLDRWMTAMKNNDKVYV